jgi:small GTP-binding protein
MQTIKVVAIGDSGVGKTCLYLSYTSNAFPEQGEYVPTVLDNYSANVEFEGTTFTLALWDTATAEDYPQLRALSYPEASVFLVCYSITSPTSFARITTHWIPEVGQYAPGVPVVLCGNKADLRDNEESKEQLKSQGLKIITSETALELGKEVNAAAVVECSALTGQGVKNVFETCLMIARNNLVDGKEMNDKKVCSLM